MRTGTLSRRRATAIIWLPLAAPAALFGFALRSIGTLEIDSGLLVVASRAAVLSAVLASCGAVFAAVRGRRRIAGGSLVAAGAASAAVAAGLERLGSTFAEDGRGARPEMLNTIFDTVTGTGAALDPVPCVLAVGVVAVGVVGIAATRFRLRSNGPGRLSAR